MLPLLRGRYFDTLRADRGSAEAPNGADIQGKNIAIALPVKRERSKRKRLLPKRTIEDKDVDIVHTETRNRRANDMMHSKDLATVLRIFGTLSETEQAALIAFLQRDESAARTESKEA